MNVYLVGAGPSYSRMFKDRGWTEVFSIEKADLVQFLGGADVNPKLYGETPHPTTNFNEYRDTTDKTTYVKAMSLCIPVAGICRGGQFLNVMNGGTLYQDVDGHLGSHIAYTADGKEVEVSSTHHQMMIPDTDGVVLMTARCSTRREVMLNGEAVIDASPNHDDVEALYYPDNNVLCFQPHPEIMAKDSDCQEVYFKFIKEKLGVGS